MSTITDNSPLTTFSDSLSPAEEDKFIGSDVIFLVGSAASSNNSSNKQENSSNPLPSCSSSPDPQMAWAPSLMPLISGNAPPDTEMDSAPPGAGPQLIRAHRCVLIRYSSVFKSMFSGRMVEARSPNKPIVIDDIEPAYFRTFLRLLYGADPATLLTDENVLQVWYCSSKYDCGFLERQCIAHCSVHMLNSRYACDIFSACYKFGWYGSDDGTTREGAGDLEETRYYLDLLRDQITAVIQMDTSVVLCTAGFSNLPPAVLKLILSMEKLNASEVELYIALLQWSVARIKKREKKDSASMDVDDFPSTSAGNSSVEALAKIDCKLLRAEIGDIIYCIRFAQIPLTVTNLSGTFKILTDEEQAVIQQQRADLREIARNKRKKKVVPAAAAAGGQQDTDEEDDDDEDDGDGDNGAQGMIADSGGDPYHAYLREMEEMELGTSPPAAEFTRSNASGKAKEVMTFNWRPRLKPQTRIMSRFDKRGKSIDRRDMAVGGRYVGVNRLKFLVQGCKQVLLQKVGFYCNAYDEGGKRGNSKPFTVQMRIECEETKPNCAPTTTVVARETVLIKRDKAINGVHFVPLTTSLYVRRDIMYTIIADIERTKGCRYYGKTRNKKVRLSLLDKAMYQWPSSIYPHFPTAAYISFYDKDHQLINGRMVQVRQVRALKHLISRALVKADGRTSVYKGQIPAFQMVIL